MPDFVIELERTVTARETSQFVVKAADLGEAERLARERVGSGLDAAVRWRVSVAQPGRPVVVDVVEVPAAGVDRAA